MVSENSIGQQAITDTGPEPAPVMLPANWCNMSLVDGVSVEKPGIYEWSVEGAGFYIGKYKRITRPTKEYARNVSNFLNGKAYRPAKPAGYRRIHRELAKAHTDGRKISLTILENVDPANLSAREAELIRKKGNLNDPPFGSKTGAKAANTSSSSTGHFTANDSAIIMIGTIVEITSHITEEQRESNAKHDMMIREARNAKP